MEYRIKDIIEYIVALVSEFASHYNITEKQAYRYISFHNGISFIEENYNIIHTLDFKEALESLVLFCRKSGGKI